MAYFSDTQKGKTEYFLNQPIDDVWLSNSTMKSQHIQLHF